MPRSRLLICSLLVSLFALWPLVAQEPVKPYTPDVKPASQEGERAIARFKVPPGFKVELWAAEPMLANPVCFTFDEKGRMFVAETFRLHAGVTDIRGHMNWLDDDLACRTVEDRDKLMRKWLGKDYPTYGQHHDRIRLLEDTKGNGRADKATVFADGFQSPVSGIGAGLLAENGKVWYTCIPHLWLLEEKAGKADKRTMLSDGYGIHIGYLGHDLHGLIKGPDGRLYFSLGDRGCHLKTKEGKLISNPDSGCVLRCDPDGSNLELYATGLRNPQELAFDEFGNLFTVDNNSDGGDKARLTYIVEGGDYGWRIGYQFLHWPVARGPWNAEEMWVPEKARDVAYIVPSIANISDGPSGLAYYPGVGLPDRYKGHFFLADFRGGAGHSGIRSFAVEPQGAGFKLKDDHQFLWGILATDVGFGPDCAMYVSDWVDGWGLTGKGRIYKVTDPTKAKSKETEEVKKILSAVPAQESPYNPKVDLVHTRFRLLDHPDMRVRHVALDALVKEANYLEEGELGSAMPSVFSNSFRQIAQGKWRKQEKDGKSELRFEAAPLAERIVSLWGSERMCRDHGYYWFLNYYPERCLTDKDSEIRAQAARLFGTLPSPETLEKVPGLEDDRYKKLKVQDKTIRAKLIELLNDPSPRVRFFAAQSVGKLKHKPAVQPLLAMLRANNDQDPYLRHAGVLALVWIDDRAALHQAMKDESSAVRLAVCVALRRLEDPAIAQLLDDADPKVVLEAARAIYDAPIPAALHKLASLSERSNLHEAVWFRVLNAHFRLGQPENAKAIAAIAARADLSETVRREALYLLGQWEKPSGRDRMVGLWRPLPNRPRQQAATAFQQVIAGVLTGPSQVRQEAVRLAARFDLKEVSPQLVRIVNDPNQPAAARVQAMEALQVMRDTKLVDLARQTLKDAQPRVRAAALTVLARHEPREAWPLLEAAMQRGHLLERQAAITALATIDHDRAESVLAEGLERLMTNQIPEGMQLELVTAARKRNTSRLKALLRDYEASMKQKPLGTYRLALAGGDAERGKNIFLHKDAVSCLRCHKIGGNGGEVGPDLSKLGGEKTREYLLESIVEPNKQIAKGFDTVVVLLGSGQLVTGVMKGETATELKLMTPEGKPLTILKKDIEERQTGKSSMPEDLVKHLSLEELRDVVEFLAGQK